MLSPSAIAVKALKLKPTGTVVCAETHAGQTCAVCGVPLIEGQPIDTLELPISFTNHSALADAAGKWRCGDCTTVMTVGDFQMQLATVLLCEDGAYPIMTKEARAWALLNPPQAPFVVSIQNAKQQHVVWRAPVSLSRDLIMVRVGETILRLRRPQLIAAREAALLLNARRSTLLDAKGKPVKIGKEMESPFVVDWKLQSCDGGSMKAWAWQMLDQARVTKDEMAPLFALNAGEAWALTAVLFPNPEAPTIISQKS